MHTLNIFLITSKLSGTEIQYNVNAQGFIGKGDYLEDLGIDWRLIA
jgi:hypothetical protein